MLISRLNLADPNAEKDLAGQKDLQLKDPDGK